MHVNSTKFNFNLDVNETISFLSSFSQDYLINSLNTMLFLNPWKQIFSKVIDFLIFICYSEKTSFEIKQSLTSKLNLKILIKLNGFISKLFSRMFKQVTV